MEQSQIDEFLQTYAPADVQDTVAWLSTNGYALVAQNGDSCGVKSHDFTDRTFSGHP